MKKTILISGGYGVLGSEFASSLSKDENNTIIILDLPNAKINKFVQSNWFCPIDITDEIEIQYAINQIYKQHGIDILINCAAYNEQPNENTDNSFENYSLDKWKKTLDVNLTGAFLLSRECIKYMLKKERNFNEYKGTIINIASDLGIIVPDHRIYNSSYKKPVDYCISKAGLIHLTKYIASYYGNQIKSVCLSPGSVYNGQSDILKKNLEDKKIVNSLVFATKTRLGVSSVAAGLRSQPRSSDITSETLPARLPNGFLSQKLASKDYFFSCLLTSIK